MANTLVMINFRREKPWSEGRVEKRTAEDEDSCGGSLQLFIGDEVIDDSSSEHFVKSVDVLDDTRREHFENCQEEVVKTFKQAIQNNSFVKLNMLLKNSKKKKKQDKIFTFLIQIIFLKKRNT